MTHTLDPATLDYGLAVILMSIPELRTTPIGQRLTAKLFKDSLRIKSANNTTEYDPTLLIKIERDSTINLKPWLSLHNV